MRARRSCARSPSRILATEPSHAFFGAWWPAGRIIGYEHTFIHTAYDFLEALASGERVKPDSEDGVRNKLALEAIEEAARTRRWVKVAPL